MTTLEMVQNYSPAGDMISFICSAVLLMIIARVLYFLKDNKFSYIKKALHFIMIASVTNVGFMCLAKNYNGAKWQLYLARDIYHICLSICLFYFLSYMKEMLDVQGKLAVLEYYGTRFFFLFAVIFEGSSPGTKLGLHAEGEIWHDPVLSPYNVFYIYTIIILCVMLLFFSNRMIRSVRICLIVTEVVVAAIMIYQAVRNVNTFTTFTYLLPILVVMILLHSKPYDDKTGAISASSFTSFIKDASKKGTSFDYMILKLNMNVENNLPPELGKILNSFWHTSFRDAVLFNIDRDLFVLAIPRNAKNGDTEEKVVALMKEDFPKHYARFKFQYKIIGLFDIDFVESIVDLTGIIKYLLVTMDDNTMQLVDEEKKKQLRLLKSIKENLSDIEAKGDLDDPRVLAYCQPIMNLNTGKYDTAEALMRLSLPGEGFIMPYMFITIAEQYGHIHMLSRIMLNKVCKKIKEMEDAGYDFKRISVNFAASEIKDSRFCGEVIEIIEANNIDPSRIGIELTETQNESDFLIVKAKIKELREKGITLYLDDVGTGYSNLERIVKYDVDVVKFDRFFLLEAEKDEKVIKMMKHISEAFRDLNYELLYEGVETEENEQVCVGCGADYIQGFKYSKPVPIDELTGFFEK